MRDKQVGWETPEEWEFEQRTFNAANNPALPEEVRDLLKDLWSQYCMAAAKQHALTKKGRILVVAARTSGGAAGRDEELCRACEWFEKALAFDPGNLLEA